MAKKWLGQNFLNDGNIINQISETFITTSNDLIIEIGLGMGALTKKLVIKDGDYLGYEIDTDLKDYLVKYQTSNKNIIFDDFLKRDISKDINKKYDNIYVIANLPYYITTPIIEKITTLGLVKGMTLLVQKEVGERFLASNGTSTYGYFTAYLNYFYDMKKVIDVSRDKFNPSPKVDSMVVKFISNIKENLDFESFNRFLKKCFINKRKTLRNNLGIDLELYGYKNSVRAEELSIYDLIDLFKKIK